MSEVDETEAVSELAMFPLGSTVFPTQIVPLHVFEDRYRTMMADLTAEDAEPTFGIVLIERGFEVGGGDTRGDVATRVRILQAEEFDDGRWGVVAGGLERVEVIEWLDDAPYPRARVRPRPVRDTGGADLDDLGELLVSTLRSAARLAGGEIPDEIEFSVDPIERLDQYSALSPLTPFDRQRVLEARTTTDQIEMLRQLLEDKQQLLAAELGET